MTKPLISQTRSEKVNERVKQAQKMYQCPTWRLAELAGCSETTMFRRMRHEMPESVQDELIELIRNSATQYSQEATT